MTKNNHKKSNFVIPIAIISLIFLVAGGGYYMGIKTSSSGSHSMSVSQNSKGNDLVELNLNFGEPGIKYFTSQITAPTSYFATDDNMISSYATRGGMAPPRIILMKGYQVNKPGPGGYIDYLPAINQTKDDCIVIWSTRGFSSIDEWNDNSATDLKSNLIDREEITVGKRKAELYRMTRNKGDIYVALLRIKNSEGTSYYFHTCNTNNKSDFVNVIKSIRFRDDIIRDDV